MRIATLSLLLLLTGCTRVVYITPQIELPPEPVLPTIFAVELECLSEGTYETLVRREERLKGHIDVLRAVIQTHNEGADK
jgi:hypothetical protein